MMWLICCKLFISSPTSGGALRFYLFLYPILLYMLLEELILFPRETILFQTSVFLAVQLAQPYGTKGGQNSMRNSQYNSFIKLCLGSIGMGHVIKGQFYKGIKGK